MRRAAAVLLGLSLVAAAAPASGVAQEIRIGGSKSEVDARAIPRLQLSQADHAIVTTDGRAALLLRPEGVVLQFTDAGLREVVREREQVEGGFFARLIGNMVRDGVRTLLDHGLQVPLSELREARYDEGRLYFITHDGEEIFGEVEVNDTKVMEGFSRRDARGFVRKFEEMKRAGSRTR